MSAVGPVKPSFIHVAVLQVCPAGWTPGAKTLKPKVRNCTWARTHCFIHDWGAVGGSATEHMHLSPEWQRAPRGL